MVKLWVKFPWLSLVTLPRLMLVPLACSTNVTCVPPGRKLLPMTVAVCPAMACVGLMLSLGEALDSRV
jgi:hypothetical protein